MLLKWIEALQCVGGYVCEKLKIIAGFFILKENNIVKERNISHDSFKSV